MDAVTYALHHAGRVRRIWLLDQAALVLRSMDPRPCGSTRCPPDCEPCMGALARGIVWLSRMPQTDEPEPLHLVEEPRQVRPESVVERLRRHREDTERRELTETEQRAVALFDRGAR